VTTKIKKNKKKKESTSDELDQKHSDNAQVILYFAIILLLSE